MSADDGILIRKTTDGRYEVRHYSASGDESADEMRLLAHYTTLEEAIARGQQEGTEYGLHFDLAGNKPRASVVIRAKLVSQVWETEVELNGEVVGGGTSPDGFLDLVADVLYGDTNDHLNGYKGALGELLAESPAR